MKFNLHDSAAAPHRAALAAMLFAASAFYSLEAADEWPEWRGPNADGNAAADAKGLPLTWSDSENVVWKIKVPGRGYSTPVISDNHMWMTTAFEVKADAADAAKRLEANTGNQPLTVLKKQTS